MLVVAVGLDGPVAVVPAGDAARRVGPDHVQPGAALFRRVRELVVDELVLGLGVLRAGAGEVDGLAVEDGLLDQRLGDVLRAPGVDAALHGDAQAVR